MQLPLRILVPAVVLFAASLYAITVAGTFIYDDVAVVLTDGRISDPHRWGEYWTDSYNFGVDNLYRPLVSMTYAIEYRLHAMTAWPYHAVNVALHAVASAMVAWVAFKLHESLAGIGRRDATPSLVVSISIAHEHQRRRGVAAESQSLSIALIAGLLFAAHPVHVEAVANIVGRAELMCAIAMLGAIGLAIGPLSRARVFGIWLCCALAILCKEQGILAALMVGVVRWRTRDESSTPTAPRSDGRSDIRSESASKDITVDYETIRSRSGGRDALLLSASLFVALLSNVAVIVFVRENLIHLKFWWDRKFLDPWIQPLSDSVGIDRWLVPITITGRYLGLLVAPVTLRIDYGGLIVPGVFNARDPFFWLGVLAIVMFFTLCVVAWRSRDRYLDINLALFAIAYALVSNIPTIIGVNVAERLMYLPSVFFVMIAASLIARLPKRAMVGVVSIVALLFSIRTVTYAYRWNDRVSFYEYATKVEPRSMKATLLAMQENADLKRWDAAEKYGRHAIEIDPEYSEAWLRLAGVLIEKGDLVGAREAIEKTKTMTNADLNRIGKYEAELTDATGSEPVNPGSLK